MLNDCKNKRSSADHQSDGPFGGKYRRICCGQNITYVGVGVILRESADHGLELLLAQEAKKQCLGKWYIPAGRIEPGETILEGVVREVLEETGYKCEPEALLTVQVQGSAWYRFSFYCIIVGGERKVTADNESLCANWFPVDEVKAKKMDLRSSDFLKIVAEALKYRQKRGQYSTRILPVPPPIPGLFIEFAILRSNSEKTEILVRRNISDGDTPTAAVGNALPVVKFDNNSLLPVVIVKFFQNTLINGRNALEMPKELLQVQCLPVPADDAEHGIRIRVLCNQKQPLEKSSEIRDPQKYYWIEVNDAILEHLHLLPNQYRPLLNIL